MSHGRTDVARWIEPPAAEPWPPIEDVGAGRGPGWLDAYLQTGLPELVRLRRQVHAHPELARAESATSALILRTLAEAGIPASLLPSGTGVVAEIGTGDRIIGLRADIDALPLVEDSGLSFSSTIPGVSHACGHDVHLTVLLGVARALASAGPLPGRVRLIFQPAEETMPGGSQDVIAAGALHGLERIFALHCDPRLEVGKAGLRVGAITSTSDLIELTVTGPGGHTARPHLTADLIYALGLVITGLPGLLSRRLDPRTVPVLVWGAVGAGDAPNAIPERGVLRGTLRMMDRSGWDLAEPLIRELVADLLAPTGARWELHYQRGVPPVENEAACVAVLRSAVAQSLGADSVTLAEQSTGAEDFAEMLEHVPGALVRLGVWDGVGPQVDLHSPTFRADERALPAGVRLMVHAVLAAFAAPPPA